MRVNFSINSEIRGKNFTAWLNTLKNLQDNTILFLLSNDSVIFKEIHSKTRIKLAPIYSVLQNTSKSSKNHEISQIDQSGRVIPSSFCPNNPELEHIIRADFENLSESSQITGIQLENLEMNLKLPNLGCFCSNCSALAEKRGIALHEISTHIVKNANNGLNLPWIKKQFPDWLKFRMDSVTNLAGRLMVAIRKINPDLFLGLNVNFSKSPEFLGHDYFYLALFLDLLNFVSNRTLWNGEKRLLKQIRSVTSKFLGDIKVFLQIKVPNEFNPEKLNKFIARLKKNSFDGFIFKVITHDELNLVNLMQFEIRRTEK